MSELTIGRFEIRDELGEGGMGTVYRAYDPMLGREVALKVLQPQLYLQDPQFSLRFEREAKTIAALEHSNVVSLYEFGEDGEWLYIVMRLMEGGALRKRLEAGPLSLEETIAIVRRIGSALDRAHSQGIVHRDLKPANILFDEDGEAFLSDFGIVKAEDATGLKTRTGHALGTPHYMSPEQLDGKEVDGRSDIYSLGVVLYEMLSGSRPYEDESTARIIVMQLTAPVPSIVEANPDLSPELQAVINKAMAKEPAERYGTAAEMVEALKAVAVKKAAPSAAVVTAAPIEPLVEVEPAATLSGKPSPAVADDVKKDGLPSWIWWAGAAIVVLLLGFGIRAIFGGGGDETMGPNVPPPDAELGSVWERPQDQVKMVYVPPGTFPMGSNNGGNDEQPVHYVTLDGFWIDRTEISNDQFAEFVADTGYVTTAEESGSGWIYSEDGRWEEREGADWKHPQGPDSDLSKLSDHPVVLVAWHDAGAYCKWVDGMLPTEAQWEYAARGPEGMEYPWGENFDGEKVNYCDKGCVLDWKDEAYDDGYAQTAPVGSYPEGASWAGALDMAGNVWEWVSDWYVSDYYANSPAKNPAGPESDSSKVLRGGSWYSDSIPLRGADRDFIIDRDYRHDSFGFRCVLPGG